MNRINTSTNNRYNAVEKIIYDDGLHIIAIDVYKELDLMLVILDTSVILRQKISSYTKLKTASKDEIIEYEIIADGTGIHWPSLDEYLITANFYAGNIAKLFFSH